MVEATVKSVDKCRTWCSKCNRESD